MLWTHLCQTRFCCPDRDQFFRLRISISNFSSKACCKYEIKANTMQILAFLGELPQSTHLLRQKYKVVEKRNSFACL